MACVKQQSRQHFFPQISEYKEFLFQGPVLKKEAEASNVDMYPSYVYLFIFSATESSLRMVVWKAMRQGSREDVLKGIGQWKKMDQLPNVCIRNNIFIGE